MRHPGAALAFVGLLTAVLATPRTSAQQAWAGARASWQDVESWSQPVDQGTATEVGLGLRLSGPGGTVPLAFLSRRPLKDAATAPEEVQIQATLDALSNPNAVQKGALTLVADAGTSRQVVFDLAPRLVMDDPSPGGRPRHGMSSLRAADLVRLAQSETLSGNVLGFDIFFRPDQIRALRTFAARLSLLSPARE
jgi:hypothetical protein